MSEETQSMGDQRSRLGAANLSVPLMLVAFLLIAGFLWWLGRSSEPSEVQMGEGATVAEAPEDGAVTQVTENQLIQQPQQFEGQVVRVSDADVATAVGAQAFFLDFPQSPFLVKLGQGLVEQGRTVPQGTVTVVGTLRAMNDSILQDWSSREIIPPGDELLVEFATHFIEARSVESTGGEGPDQN